MIRLTLPIAAPLNRQRDEAIDFPIVNVEGATRNKREVEEESRRELLAIAMARQNEPRKRLVDEITKLYQVYKLISCFLFI